MKKKLRIDILLVLIIPYVLGVLLNYFLFPKPQMNLYFFSLGCLIILTGLIVENVTNREVDKVQSKDSGLLSGMVISLCLLLISLNSYHQLLFIIPIDLQLSFILFGILIFIFGGYLRVRAKKDLSGHFSHSLKIDSNHKLITHGLYRKLRHPAYTGTLLIIVGTSLIFNSWIGIALVILLAPIGIKRIKLEEEMLTKKFGEDYKLYMKRVKRVIPYIY